MTAGIGGAFDASGRYRVLEELGAGAFGVVYRVLDKQWNQEVALKTIQHTTPEGRQWLKAEYRALRDIVHPNLIRLHDLHVEGEQCFFTMDVVPGGRPFTAALDFDRSAPEAAQILAIRRICRAGAELAEALSTVHAWGRSHRDVKPSNILVGADDHVVLLDFGLATPVSRPTHLDTARGAVLGTLPYLAPEQYWDPKPLPASDWYSVGLVLYEALVGRLPFTSDPVDEVRAKRRLPDPPSREVPAIPAELDRLVLGLLAPQPDQRMTGPEALSILRALGDEPGTAARGYFPIADSDQDFVSRDAELATLTEAYTTARNGALVVVDVVGPSGMGKTALVRHFLRGVREREGEAPLVLEARCHPHESIPYKAFDAAIDDLARYWVGLSETASLDLCPAGGVEALALLFPELLRVPTVEVRASKATAKGDPRALRQSGFAALAKVLARVAETRPVVLWVDDAQWVDADSVALVESVFGGRAAPPVMLVVSRRPEGGAMLPALLTALGQAKSAGRGFEIEVAPLPSDSALALVRKILDRAGMGGDRTMAGIVEEAGGVPYLVSELAYFAGASRERPENGALPATAGSLLQERIQALSEEDRRLVEVAALSGAAQRAAVLLEAAGSRDRHRLRALCLLRLLRWNAGVDGESLQIYHDRLREFVVSALPREVSVQHHLSLVSAMEAAGSDDAEQLMAHALAAGDRPRTVRHAMTAARRAAAALAFEQAARHYRVALEHLERGAPRAEVHGLLADALANAGRSTDAAPEFERGAQALARESPGDVERRALFRRRAGEQYLKAGRFEEGLRLMEQFLGGAGVRLPKTGNGALLSSAGRRLRLYVRGFDYRRRAPEEIPAATRSRLDDLWASTTALSMMDPVRADTVGLLHFLEALRVGDEAHVARSLGYEAAFAALIGGGFLRARSRDLVQRNLAALGPSSTAYERAFYLLGAGSSAFFHSDWERTVSLCDAAAAQFRAECRGAEYEAAVAIVFSLQALGQAGKVAELCARIPAAIREAEARGDLFAANNYRGGFHGVARVAAGRVAEVRADLERVVETWKPGFYQMHAYHRVFCGVALDLHEGDPRSAVARIEGDWPELRDGLFLRMELPAMELRWTRARAALALACQSTGGERRALLSKVDDLIRGIRRATVAAARPHAALLRAGVLASEPRREPVVEELRLALSGYTSARMALHREVTRWALARALGGGEGDRLESEATSWMRAEGISDLASITKAIAPGVERAFAR